VEVSCSVRVESTTPQNIEITVTSRIGSGGFCRHLIDANVRVATNYPAVNAVVPVLQKDCQTGQIHGATGQNCRGCTGSQIETGEHSSERRGKSCRISVTVIGRGPLYNLPWRQIWVGRVETGKILLWFSLLNSLTDPPTKNKLVIPTHDNPDPTSGSPHESQQSHLWPKCYPPFAMSCLPTTHFAIPIAMRIFSIPLTRFSLLHSHVIYHVPPSLLRHTVHVSMSNFTRYTRLQDG